MGDGLPNVDEPLAGVAAAVVATALAAVGTLEYVVPGLASSSADPLATGVLVVAAGVALFGAGSLAIRASLDHLALRIGTGLGVVTLALAVIRPAVLLFGGVFWLGLLLPALIALAASRTGRRGLAGPD